MFKNPYTKILIVFAVLLFSILAIIPSTPVNIDNKYFKIGRPLVFGGYEFSLFEGNVDLDFSKFDFAVDLFGGSEIILEPSDKEALAGDNVEKVKSILKQRIEVVGSVPEGSYVIEVKPKEYVSIKVPEVGFGNELLNVLEGKGTVTFKQLKEGEQWNQEEAMRFYLNPDLWEETGLNQEDLRALVPTGDAQIEGEAQTQAFQVIFTEEGLNKFSETAKNNLEKPLALYLNNSEQPFAMPVVPPEFEAGITSNPTIRGSLNSDQIEILNTQLQAQELPVSLSISSIEEIDTKVTEDLLTKVFLGSAIAFGVITILLTVLFRKHGFIAAFSTIIFLAMYIAVFKGTAIPVSLYSLIGAFTMLVLHIVLNFTFAAFLRKEYKLDRPGLAVVNLGFKRFWTIARLVIGGIMITAIPVYYIVDAPWKTLLLSILVGDFVLLFNIFLISKPLFEVFGRGKT